MKTYERKYEVRIVCTSKDYVSLFSEIEKVVKLLKTMGELQQLSIVEMQENEGEYENNTAY